MLRRVVGIAGKYRTRGSSAGVGDGGALPAVLLLTGAQERWNKEQTEYFLHSGKGLLDTEIIDFMGDALGAGAGSCKHEAVFARHQRIVG